MADAHCEGQLFDEPFDIGHSDARETNRGFASKKAKPLHN